MIDQEGIKSLEKGASNIRLTGNEGESSPAQENIKAGIPKDITMDQAFEVFIKSEGRPPKNIPELLEFFKNRTLSEGFPTEEYQMEFERVFPDMIPLRGTQEYDDALEEYFRGLAKGPVLPSDEDPINPFGPKPIGPVLPDRQMAAFGGIMGLDNRKQYGFGSSFKKAFRKFTKPFTKVAQKLMPRELAGVAQFAAPFAGQYAPLLYAAGAAKQRGKINPITLAMMAAPYARMTPEKGLSYGTAANNPGSYGIRDLITGGGKGSSYTGESLFDKVGAGDFGLKTDEFLFGKPEGYNYTTNIDGTKELGDAAGLIGSEGEMYQLLGGDVGILDTKIGSAALARGKDPTKLSKLKLGSWGIGIAANIKAKKYADEMEAAEAAEDALLAADAAASEAEVQAARAWAAETFSRLTMADFAKGGRINKEMGGNFNIPPGGLSSLQTKPSDVTPPGMELDLRGGGFIPIGKAEKADDVPARVSKNEFVFTADAVKAAGGGSVNEGAKKMYDTMKKLESQVA